MPAMSGAEDSLATCCCCLPLNIFTTRQLCVFIMIAHTFDAAINIAVFSTYASYDLAAESVSSVYTTLWLRIIVSLAITGLSAMLAHFLKAKQNLYVAIWLVTVYVAGVLNFMLCFVYSCSIPGKSIKRHSSGVYRDNAPVEISSDTAMYGAMSMGQYLSFLVTLLTTVYCWKSIFQMYLIETLDERPMMKALVPPMEQEKKLPPGNVESVFVELREGEEPEPIIISETPIQRTRRPSLLKSLLKRDKDKRKRKNVQYSEVDEEFNPLEAVDEEAGPHESIPKAIPEPRKRQHKDKKAKKKKKKKHRKNRDGEDEDEDKGLPLHRRTTKFKRQKPPKKSNHGIRMKAGLKKKKKKNEWDFDNFI